MFDFFFRYVKSLVILMVDLLDFPCSVWPGIVDIIGTKRPLFIVANKVLLFFIILLLLNAKTL